RRDLARRAAREPWPGITSRRSLSPLLDLYPALHPHAVLCLCLRLRRLPGELALRGLPGRPSRICREVSGAAARRRYTASSRALGTLRPRRRRPRLLVKGPLGDFRLYRRARAAGAVIAR